MSQPNQWDFYPGCYQYDASQYTNQWGINATAATALNNGSSRETWQRNDQWTSNYSNVGQSNFLSNSIQTSSGQFNSPGYQDFFDIRGRMCATDQMQPNEFTVGQSNVIINSIQTSSGQFNSPGYQNFFDVHGRMYATDQWQPTNQRQPTNQWPPTFDYCNRGQSSGHLHSQGHQDVHGPVHATHQWQPTNQWPPTSDYCNRGQSSGHLNSQGHQDVHGPVHATDQWHPTNQQQPTNQWPPTSDYCNRGQSSGHLHSQGHQDVHGPVNERNDETIHEENEHFVEVEGINPSHDESVPIANQQSPELLTLSSKQKRGCDNSKMFVRTSDDKPKKLVCPFCQKLFFKIPRHLEQKHNSEPDVKKFLSFSKGSTERRQILDALRKDGTNEWNKNAKLNNNELIPSRRPNPKHKKTGADYTSCPYCHASLTKTGLRYHVNKKCPNKPITNNTNSEPERVITALATASEARIHVNASEALEKIFTSFRGDRVVQQIRFDWLVIVYGNKLAEKYQEHKDERMIRYRVRLASRIMSALKEIEPDVTEFVQIYNPKYYDSLIQAIKNFTRLNYANHELSAPTTATDALTAIKQIGQMLISEYIKRDNQEGQRITKNFVTLVEYDAPIAISKTVTRIQKRRKRQSKVVLPSLEDLRIFSRYVDSERERFFGELSDKFVYNTWKYLSELTMVSIIIFNRKRVGDTENIEVGDFDRREIIEDSSDHVMYQSLSDEDKEIAKQFSRMKVSGKKDSDVYVLLKPEFEKAIALLIKHREDAGLSSDNKFLFELPSSRGKIRLLNGCDAMKRISSDCEAKNPSTLRGTLLRKQLATFCATIGLEDDQVGDVAVFMGHEKEVHLKTYRQNTIERQIVKISKVLNAAQGNTNNLIDNTVHANANKVIGGRVRKIKKITPSRRQSKRKNRGGKN